MKRLVNMTTSPEDLDRLAAPGDLDDLLDGMDGLELMVLQPDERGLLPKERVVGLHMDCLPTWVDFWRGDRDALAREFGDEETWARVYGGTDRAALVQRVRRDFAHAAAYGAEYLVFHVADATIEEGFTGRYHLSDQQVIDASCELLNEALGDGAALGDYRPALLFENLWAPGLTMTDPAMTRRLLAGVAYPNTGIMLDTGHLMHTNTALRTQPQALAYIHQLLDAHGELCAAVRGMHLHQSLTGAYHQRVQQDPPALAVAYAERQGQLFGHIFRLDRHRPFTCPGVAGLVERLSPQWLTFEFISRNNRQLKHFLARQAQILGKA